MVLKMKIKKNSQNKKKVMEKTLKVIMVIMKVAMAMKNLEEDKVVKVLVEMKGKKVQVKVKLKKVQMKAKEMKVQLKVKV